MQTSMPQEVKTMLRHCQKNKNDEMQLIQYIRVFLDPSVSPSMQQSSSEFTQLQSLVKELKELQNEYQKLHTSSNVSVYNVLRRGKGFRCPCGISFINTNLGGVVNVEHCMK